MCCTSTVPNEESPGHLVEYKGTYSQYRAARAKDEVRLAKIAAQQDAEIKRLSTLADKIRAKATLASKAHNLDKRADRIRAAHVEAPTRERTLTVKLPPPPHTGRVLLEVDGVAKSYDGPPVFSDVSFALERGERLLVLGLNGAGKTSLLRILAGESIADTRHGRVRARRLARLLRAGARGHHRRAHAARPHARPRPHDRRRAAQPARHVRPQRRQGVPGRGTLSGGEKTKLALAQLVAGRHNLLLLDEPTNNLDPGSRSAVAAALASWPGGMVIVSHDREFVEELAARVACCSCPTATLDYWTDDLIELVALLAARRLGRRVRHRCGDGQCTHARRSTTRTGRVIGPLMPITGFHGAGPACSIVDHFARICTIASASSAFARCTPRQ